MSELQIGDKVRHKLSGEEGTVEIVMVPERLLRDCALIRFSPHHDGMCIPRRLLEKV